ncbi:MAG TPA: DUF4363 family protein [Papillibacter sp.]|jgi:hypothetical protein|nr:DUF4363 family protein [Papillibacter sp.]
MKKELVAVVVLVLMLIASICNYKYIEGITEEVLSLVDRSLEEGERGNWDDARRHGEEAAKLWESYDGYTHIFLRHSEIVDADAVLYHFIEQIYSQNISTAKAAREAARARLEHLVQVEKLRPGSIF